MLETSLDCTLWDDFTELKLTEKINEASLRDKFVQWIKMTPDQVNIILKNMGDIVEETLVDEYTDDKGRRHEVYDLVEKERPTYKSVENSVQIYQSDFGTHFLEVIDANN